MVKGKPSAVAAYCAHQAWRGLGSGAGSARPARARRARRAELATLHGGRSQDSLARGRASVGVTAEAGIGKSRLLAEFVRSVRERRSRGAVGECPAVRHERELRRLAGDLAPSAGASTTSSRRMNRYGGDERALGPSTRRSCSALPLLGPVLGIAIPDNELTRTFDAKLRKESLEGLLAECLRARAAEQPLVLMLEDCHWIDPLSRDLLEVLAREAARAAGARRARRPDRGVSSLGVEQLPQFTQVELGELDAVGRRAADPREGSSSSFGAGARRRRRRSSSWCTAAAQGNPFYIEELLDVHPQRGRRPRGRGGLCGLAAARQPAQPDPQPDRHAGRVAAAHAQGGQRRRALVPRAGAARHLSGARVGSTTSASHLRHPAGARPRGRRRAGRRRLRLQPRRHAGGRVREPAVRDPRRCSTSASAATSRRPKPTPSGHTSTCSRTTTG